MNKRNDDGFERRTEKASRRLLRRVYKMMRRNARGMVFAPTFYFIMNLIMNLFIISSSHHESLHNFIISP